MPIRETSIPGIDHQNINFPDHAYAHQLLDHLHGIELGPSAHNSFHLPGSLALAPADDYDFYKIQGQARVNGRFCEVDIFAEACATTLPDNSQDYVLSSHVAEHIPDLVRAFQEWSRIVRPGGFVFLILPQRDALPSDVGRPLSTWEDVRRAYDEAWTPENAPEAIRGTHGSFRGHFWVFTLHSFLEIVSEMTERKVIDWELIHTEDPDAKVGNGFCAVYKGAQLAQSSQQAGKTK